mmetsp:Transcript_20067/g.43190  ORF Transcript_20067/g.43190 Transcript_20067/m.43190 type:complete len:101 (-) Transcript_20067:1530-1832(-)
MPPWHMVFFDALDLFSPKHPERKERRLFSYTSLSLSLHTHTHTHTTRKHNVQPSQQTERREVSSVASQRLLHLAPFSRTLPSPIARTALLEANPDPLTLY